MKTTRILIVGGGFAGLYAAMRFEKQIARRADVEVTLISRENFILFTPMLHEVAAGDLYPGDIVNPLRRILRHVKVVEAAVQSIDLNLRRVQCVAGVADYELEFEFDHLLLTLGSETNFFDMDGVCSNRRHKLPPQATPAIPLYTHSQGAGGDISYVTANTAIKSHVTAR